MKTIYLKRWRAGEGIASLLLLAALDICSSEAQIKRLMLEKVPSSDSTQNVIQPAVPPSYEVLKGKVFGELDPRDPHNKVIQDLELAPRNSRGMVEYVATFTLTKPIDNAKASHVLLYEVVNRGASIVPRRYEDGDAFLQSGWQGDIPFGGKSIYGIPGETIQVPIAHKADGSVLTGPVLARFLDVRPGTNTLAIGAAVGYSSSGVPPKPFDLDTAHARLTTRSYEDVNGIVGGSKEIPSSDWAWGDCTTTGFPGKPDPAHICIKGTFDPSLLYQLEYTGKDPLVLGIGLAAMRDVVSFFRNADADAGGTPNPLAKQVRFVIAQGASQAGNTIRTFLNLGMNQDEAGRIVWDAAMPTIAARQNPINYRFAVPGGASNLYEPGSDGVVWWAHWPDDRRRHSDAGLLDRCTASKTCPKIIEVLGSSEFWSLRASPDFVGTSADRDIPLPDNVRRYYVAGTQHGGGRGGFEWTPEASKSQSAPTTQNPIVTQPCLLALNPNPMSEIIAALLVDLKEWVVQGNAPPASTYPTLAAGTLVPANHAAMGFPYIPGVPWPDDIANPVLNYELGPEFNYNDLSGAIAQLPPRVVDRLPVVVPRVDRDGNEIGGIETLLSQAPLGTYLGWNVTAAGFNKGHFCSLAGSYIPFAANQRDRLLTHDPRLSLEERYGSHDAYVERIRKAAETLVEQRFLLRIDADRMVRQAQSSSVLK